MNKRKEGLTHFPLDVDIFDDEKLIHAEELVDPSGYDIQLRAVMGKLLLQLYCFIYKNGYHINWDTKMQLTISRSMANGMTSTNVMKMVRALVGAGLFDEQSFNREILTSKRIQETWLTVVVKARRVNQSIAPELLLLTKDDIRNIKSPKSQSATEKGKNVADNANSATDSRSGKAPKPGKNSRSASNSGKNAAETKENAAENRNMDHNKASEQGKIHANSPQNWQSATGNQIPVTEKGENVAENAIPFTFNNNNKGIIDTPVITNDNNCADFSENVAGNSKSATENEKPATDVHVPDTFYKIHPSDKAVHPVEMCRLNYTTAEYATTFQQHCIRFGFSPQQMAAWAEAFNRKLIDEANTMMAMSGNGWCRYLGNWVATVDDYQNTDPTTIYNPNFNKINRNGNQRSANQSNNTGNNNGSTQPSKVGGIPSHAAQELLSRKRG